ncbi:MAG TPA: glycosyltransferase family 2 protein [Patescibacteria group bacterium]|nr:glycosyltransferase family 2 protein [Patescibacteria group bacterium]
MNVSVVIPTYNGKHLLEKNLPDVLLAIRQDDEVIIVDDASSDDTVSWVKNTYPKIRVVQNSKNLRFALSCNRGVQTAIHEIIILLNNDVSPKKDFLEHLLVHFKDEKVFAVGCKEIATNEDGKEFGRNGGKFMRGFLVHWREEYQDGTQTLWVSGGSGAFRKSMWEHLGGFDPDYRPAYWEDIDLSWRARKKGWKVLFEPKSLVYHNHESTNTNVFGKNQMEVMAYKNQILFMWKNAKGVELLKHFLWLPYHLFFTSIRSNGRFLRGFLAALTQYFFPRFSQ